ncbi:MAG: phosphatidylserine/phosphatidylglycerophosphate/cardiolipin synthase family protein [Chlamydiales bacterium]
MKKIALFFCVFLFVLNMEAEQENGVIICENSLETVRWDLELIRGAKQSIEMSACYTGGRILRALLTEISARLEVCPHLGVFLLISPVFLEELDKAIIHDLKKSYPNDFHLTYADNVLEFNSNLIAIDNHVKMLVVDEKYYSAGGTNFEEVYCTDGTYTPLYHRREEREGKYFPSGTRDQDVVGKGALAKELRQAFHHLFALWQHYNKTRLLEKDPDSFRDRNHYRPIDPSAEQAFVASFESADALIPLEEGQIQLILAGPYQKTNKITQKYRELIEHAEKEIVIGSMFFTPEKSIFETLLKAVNQEVALSVITNGIHEIAPFYNSLFGWGNRRHYFPIFYGRSLYLWQSKEAQNLSIKPTHVYEYFVKDIVYHKKVMIVDRRYFIIGSYNLGLKSHLSDYELALFIDSPEVAKRAQRVIDRDIEYSREVTLEEACKWYFDPILAFMGEAQLRCLNLL